MLEIVTMVATLYSTEVVGRTVPIAECEAVQRAVATAVSGRNSIRYYLPDRPQSPPNRIVAVACLPLLIHDRGDSS